MKYLRPSWLVPLFWPAVGANVWAAEFVPTRNDGLTKTGDVMAYVMPATALGLTACFKDGTGAWEFSGSAAITMAATVGLKYAVNARRPNGGVRSFPSGHTASAFCSAEFLRKRYGWKYGVPAYAVASLVGYSRVHAHVHYFRDVAAGAAIGFATTCIVSKPFHGWQIQPTVAANYRGFTASRDF